MLMVQQGTACRYPALLLTFSYQLSILAENILSFICCSISSIPYVSSIYSIFDCNITKGLCHIYSHLLLSLVIYCFNGFLFWSEKKARSERSIYREISKQQKNLLFIILTIVVFATYFYVLFNHTEYFILIY